MSADEVYAPIAGSPAYFVSDHGRVLSCKRGDRRHLRPVIKANGYLSVNLHAPGKRTTRAVHSLVAEAFCGQRPVGALVRHLDGDHHNNVASNLLWGTSSQNEHDKVRHGTHHEAAKTRCPQNHPYDESNTQLDARGHRSCRACRRTRNSRRTIRETTA